MYAWSQEFGESSCIHSRWKCDRRKIAVTFPGAMGIMWSVERAEINFLHCICNAQDAVAILRLMLEDVVLLLC